MAMMTAIKSRRPSNLMARAYLHCMPAPTSSTVMNERASSDVDRDDPVAALLSRYAQGDSAAARLLTIQLTPLAYGHAFRVLGDAAEAEDVAQEALMRLWKVAPDWREGDAKVSTWLYRVVANLCIDKLRKRGRGTIPLEDIAEPADPTESAATKLQHKARRDALQSALNVLPARQRQAVVLRHIDGLANSEIATILDVSIEAVESLTARGKQALAKLLRGRRDALGYDDD